jgi:type I restriction-modification system DNA methylase subunit
VRLDDNKIHISALGAPMSLAWVHESPAPRNWHPPKAAISASTRPSSGGCRFKIPDGSRWGDVKAASINIGEVLTNAMRGVADANDELRGVFTVDWNQPAPDGSGKPLIANEVVHALIQHFDEHDLSNKSVPPDILGRPYEYLIKQFAFIVF